MAAESVDSTLTSEVSACNGVSDKLRRDVLASLDEVEVLKIALSSSSKASVTAECREDHHERTMRSVETVLDAEAETHADYSRAIEQVVTLVQRAADLFLTRFDHVRSVVPTDPPEDIPDEGVMYVVTARIARLVAEARNEYNASKRDGGSSNID